MQANLGLQTNFCDALKSFAENLRFEFELALVGNVLVVAAAALLKIRAAGSDAVGGCVKELGEGGAGETGLFLVEFGLDFFAGENEGDEDGHAAAIGAGGSAGQTVAAIDQFFDGKMCQVPPYPPCCNCLLKSIA